MSVRRSGGARADERFVARAIELARRGIEAVSPNPMVGAVVVTRGRVVGEGFHAHFGGPHAEIDALRAAGSRALGATVYVSLEPCGHHGKTPPCAEALVGAGVARVVYAVGDPNPATRGCGPRLLRCHGIEVLSGVLRRAALELNAPYFHWRASGRPWVIAKWAMSLDGKIATAGGESRWITSPAARARGHAMRRRVDAVLIGTRTARVDDPLLSPRPARGRAPARVVLDRRGTLPLALRLFAADSPAGGAGARICVTARASAHRRRELARRGVEVLEIAERQGRLDLEELLGALGERGISQLLVEGGGEIVGGFVAARLVDEVLAFVAPRVLGGRAAPGAVAGEGVERLADALRLERVRCESVGADLLVSGTVARR